MTDLSTTGPSTPDPDDRDTTPAGSDDTAPVDPVDAPPVEPAGDPDATSAGPDGTATSDTAAGLSPADPDTAPEADTAPEVDAGATGGAAEFAPYPGGAGAAFPGYPADDSDTDAVAAPPEAVEREDGTIACPHCDAAIERWASYCETCGQTLTPTAPMPKAPVSDEVLAAGGSVATRRTGRRADVEPPRHPCAECGGTIGADLYCQQCGAKAPSPRDHFREAPSSWVAGVCDRGIRHHRNEDAMALAADAEPGSRAVLVVCDGVSNAHESHIASLAAARTARGVLTSQRPDGEGVAPERVAALQATIGEAARQANTAVIERSDEDVSNPPSCTYAVAIVEDGTVVYGNLGDSRVYWLDDEPERSQLLSTDDSVAQARIAMGVDRETAENGPQAHAITKWLGRDAPDLEPTTGTFTPPGSGWVLACSDGLWNYASTATELGELAQEAIRRNPGNARVRSMAVSLVRWARVQGGRDNITVALARIEPSAEDAKDDAKDDAADDAADDVVDGADSEA